MIRWLQRLLMGRHHREELETLARYRECIHTYDRWLSESPDICEVLLNLRGEAEPNEQFFSRLGNQELRYARHIHSLRADVQAARTEAAIKFAEKSPSWVPAADFSRAVRDAVKQNRIAMETPPDASIDYRQASGSNGIAEELKTNSRHHVGRYGGKRFAG